MRQLEWKSEEFDVYALKKSKEICAEYANNGAKISLKLKIKDNYPLRYPLCYSAPSSSNSGTNSRSNKN